MKQENVFKPQWPEGLQLDDFVQLNCDDQGSDGQHWLKVWVAPDGDVHLLMWNLDHPDDEWANPMPTLRCRTEMGGETNTRTHQALLWLARAIQLDAEDRNKRRLGRAESTSS